MKCSLVAILLAFFCCNALLAQEPDLDETGQDVVPAKNIQETEDVKSTSTTVNPVNQTKKPALKSLVPATKNVTIPTVSPSLRNPPFSSELYDSVRLNSDRKVAGLIEAGIGFEYETRGSATTESVYTDTQVNFQKLSVFQSVNGMPIAFQGRFSQEDASVQQESGEQNVEFKVKQQIYNFGLAMKPLDWLVLDFKLISERYRLSQDTSVRFAHLTEVPRLTFFVGQAEVSVELRQARNFEGGTFLLRPGYKKLQAGFRNNRFGSFLALLFKDNRGTLDEARDTIDFALDSYLHLGKVSGSLAMKYRRSFYSKTSQRVRETLSKADINIGVDYDVAENHRLISKVEFTYFPENIGTEGTQDFDSSLNYNFLMGVSFEK